MIIARILFAILAAFSYPLQTLPCRNSLEHLLPISSATKKQNSKLLHISLTVLILVGSFTVAFLQRSLVLISGIIGTIAGIPICYILPFLFYYKLTEGAGWTWRRIGAAFLAAFGLVAMVISAASIFFTIFYTPTLNVVGNYIL
jgi:amino acid permease